MCVCATLVVEVCEMVYERTLDRIRFSKLPFIRVNIYIYIIYIYRTSVSSVTPYMVQKEMVNPHVCGICIYMYLILHEDVPPRSFDSSMLLDRSPGMAAKFAMRKRMNPNRLSISTAPNPILSGAS